MGGRATDSAGAGEQPRGQLERGQATWNLISGQGEQTRVRIRFLCLDEHIRWRSGQGERMGC